MRTACRQLAAVLVNPRLPLATAAGLRARSRAGPRRSDADARRRPRTCRSSSDLLDYMRARGNDLETPAIAPAAVIADVKAALAAQPGCRLAAMSGSGPTCFGIFADRGASGRLRPPALPACIRGWWINADTAARTCVRVSAFSSRG